MGDTVPSAAGHSDCRLLAPASTWHSVSWRFRRLFSPAACGGWRLPLGRLGVKKELADTAQVSAGSSKEYAKAQYVVIEPDELDKLPSRSTRP
jgi:hypothetical protein